VYKNIKNILLHLLYIVLHAKRCLILPSLHLCRIVSPNNKTMRILILVFLLSLMACQQAPETVLPFTASIGFQSITGGQQCLEKTSSTATGIIFQSTDGGETWQDVSTGLPADLPVMSIFAGGGEVFLGAETGFYRSSAGSGAPTWRKELFLNERTTNIFPGRAGLYVSNYGSGFFQEIIPGSGMWKPVYANLEDKTVHTLLETTDGAVFVGCDSGIFKSADGGKTWKQVFDGGMILNIVAEGDVLISGGSQGVLRSNNGGETWDYVLNENILAKKTALLKDHFVTILGTKDPSVVSPEGITGRLRISGDGGKTWQRMEPALLPLADAYDMDKSLSQVRDLYDIIQVGEYLFCSFDTGVFRSGDMGKSWEPVLPATGKGPFNLAVSGKVIYAMVASGGC